MNNRHDKILFWGCFIALITTSYAFFSRMYLCGGRFMTDFNLDKVAAGELAGAGIWPFGVSIILFSLFIDRVGYVSRSNGGLFKRKVGGAIVAVRRTGGMLAYAELNLFFLIQEMIIPGSSYWTIGIGRMPGDVLKDEEGMNVMETLGKNMAWILKKLHG